MKKLLLFIVKNLIVIGLMYGVLFLFCSLMAWAENHFILFMSIISPIVIFLIYNELKKF